MEWDYCLSYESADTKLNWATTAPTRVHKVPVHLICSKLKMSARVSHSPTLCKKHTPFFFVQRLFGAHVVSVLFGLTSCLCSHKKDSDLTPYHTKRGHRDDLRAPRADHLTQCECRPAAEGSRCRATIMMFKKDYNCLSLMFINVQSLSGSHYLSLCCVYNNILVLKPIAFDVFVVWHPCYKFMSP